MATHYTTFVLPGSASGLGYDVPFLVLGDDVAALPHFLPTSLHRIGNEVRAMSRARAGDGIFRVSDAWITAVERDYDNRAKVVALRQAMPRDIATDYADVRQGVTEPDLPPWVRDLLEQRIPAVSRDVPVSAGANFMDIMITPSAPTELPKWADAWYGPDQN